MIATADMSRLHKRQHRKRCNTTKTKQEHNKRHNKHNNVEETTNCTRTNLHGFRDTTLHLSSLLAGLECTERSLTPISCLIHPNTKTAPGGSAGPRQTRPCRAGSTAALPRELRDTCSNSRQRSTGGMKAPRIKVPSCSLKT